MVVGDALGAPDRPGCAALRGPERADGHDLEHPDFLGIGDGQHLPAVVEAVTVFFSQGPDDLDGFPGRRRALHGQEGQHREVELGRGGGIT
jgi:hypothetical protein